MLDELLKIDESLARGTGDDYRERLTEDAVVLLPGIGVLDREACAAAVDEAGASGWDEISVSDARLVSLGEESAAVAYRFDGERGGWRYVALMASAYVRRGGEWKLALHQQTPIGA